MNTIRNTLIWVCIVAANCGTPIANADFTFETPVNLKSTIPVLDAAHDAIDCFSSDGLELYIDSDRPGGSGGYDLWVLRRASINDAWGPPENLGPAVNSPQADFSSSISADGFMLCFCSKRPGGSGRHDIYVTTRESRNALWGPAVNMGTPINTDHDDLDPWITAGGLELYYATYRDGGCGACDIWSTRRATTKDPWAQPVNLGPLVNSAYEEHFTSLSPDGLLLCFSGCRTCGSWPTPRPGGYGGDDMWMARRASRSDPWQAALNLGPIVNGPADDSYPRISPDGRMLYFFRNQQGTFSNWQAPIIPVVDFNGDGKVDGNEVLAIAQHWGENYPTCDIAPFAWGDSVVDVNDLTVLAGYIGQEVNDPTLIAHWGLDETEGMLTTDSAGGHDALVMGNAAWQPSGGKIGGALAFDGTAGFLRTESAVLDPSKGPFSVIAWVKGGAPNRVIVSQFGAADWLYLNQYGMLTTDLMSSDRKNGKSLTSSAFVLDDQWHRVVLTWDGTNRVLGVDGVEVARDTQPNLAASSAILQIGTGKNGAPTPFWTGLIDDVRIYNRVVAP